MWNVSLTKKSWVCRRELPFKSNLIISQAAKDARASQVGEFFQSIRFLKYMGWESHWINRVKASREKEIRIRVKQNAVDVIIYFIW